MLNTLLREATKKSTFFSGPSTKALPPPPLLVVRPQKKKFCGFTYLCIYSRCRPFGSRSKDTAVRSKLASLKYSNEDPKFVHSDPAQLIRIRLRPEFEIKKNIY